MAPDEEKCHLISEDKPQTPNNPPKPSNRWTVAAYTLATIAIVELCVILKLLLPHADSFATGFATDFPDAKGALNLHQVRFTSPLKVNENGTMYQEHHPDEPVYTGDSPEVDQAWNELIYGRYLTLRGSEVHWLNSDTGLDHVEGIDEHGSFIPKSGVYGGIDMIHSLHCLNMLRRDMYGSHMHMEPFTERENQMHLDHCIDQLRQSVMCSGDLTPVTLRQTAVEDPHRSFLLGETERLHTCRNFEAIRDWATRRGVHEGRIEY